MNVVSFPFIFCFSKILIFFELRTHKYYVGYPRDTLLEQNLYNIGCTFESICQS